MARTKCQCEHAAHFDGRGHDYGALRPCASVQTAYGKFFMCAGCQRAGHMMRNPPAAYRSSAYAGMPRTSYVKSGQWVRHHHPLSKNDHIDVADDFLKDASRLYDQYYQHIQRELKFLASQGVDPGPLISGVVSDKFSSSVKDGLRSQIRAINELVDAAMGHYAAAGKRVATYRAAYRRYVGK